MVIVMNTISIKVPGAPSMTPAVRISRALSLRIIGEKCCRAAAGILRFLFAENTCYAVMGVVAVVMWYHIAMIADDAAAGRQVALDALFLLPPMAAMAIRSLSRKGGEA